MCVEDNTLTEDQLMKYGNTVSKNRKYIRDTALNATNENIDDEKADVYLKKARSL